MIGWVPGDGQSCGVDIWLRPSRECGDASNRHKVTVEFGAPERLSPGMGGDYSGGSGMEWHRASHGKWTDCSIVEPADPAQRCGDALARAGPSSRAYGPRK